MNDKNQERDEVEMILPAGMLAELQTRAAKRVCTIENLIYEAAARTMRLPRLQRDALLLRAEAVDEALSRHEPPPWPSDFDQLTTGTGAVVNKSAMNFSRRPASAKISRGVGNRVPPRTNLLLRELTREKKVGPAKPA